MSKIIDEIGKKYGKLTVVSRAENNKKQRAQWNCLCDCGKQTIVLGTYLRTGHTTSCGNCGTHPHKFVDITGRKFGKLTVIERVENYQTNAQWKCQCECGNIIIARGSRLRNGHVKSCGCIKSHGEQEIMSILKEKNISFNYQYRSTTILYSKGTQPVFDFAILDANGSILFFIECNGQQHYFSRNSGWDTLENLRKTQLRDKEKQELCIKCKIPLEIIIYMDKKDIKDQLNAILKKYNLD